MLKDYIIKTYKSINSQFIKVDTSDFYKQRQQAIDSFERQGFPVKSDEEWRYTSLKPLLKDDYKIALETSQTLDRALIDQYSLNNLDTYKLVFLNGLFQPSLSTIVKDDFELNSLASHLYKNEHFNNIASKDSSLLNLNTAFVKDGVFVNIPKNIVLDKPIEIFYFNTDSAENLFVQPRNLVVAGENAQVKIIEYHHNLGKHKVFTNAVSEVYTGDYAVVDYYKIQNDTLNTSLIDNLFAQQQGNSSLFINTYSFGGDLTRNNIHVNHQSEHINTTLNGITMLQGTQHVDHQTNIYHNQPNCESHELYKGIYDDRSTGVFNGKVIVNKIAQKTDAFQQNDNILLTDEATINAKPQLEIFADDVKCSHGCTIGQLDKDALFYMKQRGIPHRDAQGLLLYAFTDDVVRSIKIPELRYWITHLIAKKLNVQLDIEV